MAKIEDSFIVGYIIKSKACWLTGHVEYSAKEYRTAYAEARKARKIDPETELLVRRETRESVKF